MPAQVMPDRVTAARIIAARLLIARLRLAEVALPEIETERVVTREAANARRRGDGRAADCRGTAHRVADGRARGAVPPALVELLGGLKDDALEWSRDGVHTAGAGRLGAHETGFRFEQARKG